MALSYLVGSVTQGGNDAFAQAEIATALTGAGNIAFRVRELLFEVPAVMAGANSNIELCLTRRSKTAMPVITDRDVIAKFKRQVIIAGAAFAATAENVMRLTFTEDDELLIVEDPVYLQIDSNAMVLTQTGYCRIGYERATISAVDRLTLLTQSLD